MTFKPNSLRTVMLMAVAPVIGLAFQSCGDDTDDYPTVDGKAPTLSLKTNHLQVEPGRTFNIEGTLKDADGLKSVRLKSEGMLLARPSIFLRSIQTHSFTTTISLTHTHLRLTGPTTPASRWK